MIALNNLDCKLQFYIGDIDYLIVCLTRSSGMVSELLNTLMIYLQRLIPLLAGTGSKAVVIRFRVEFQLVSLE